MRLLSCFSESYFLNYDTMDDGSGADGRRRKEEFMPGKKHDMTVVDIDVHVFFGSKGERQEQKTEGWKGCVGS